MLTYTISVSIRSTLLRYSLFFSEYLSNHSTRPDTINTRLRRRPSVQLETDRPGIEAITYPIAGNFRGVKNSFNSKNGDFRE